MCVRAFGIIVVFRFGYICPRICLVSRLLFFSLVLALVLLLMFFLFCSFVTTWKHRVAVTSPEYFSLLRLPVPEHRKATRPSHSFPVLAYITQFPNTCVQHPPPNQTCPGAPELHASSTSPGTPSASSTFHKCSCTALRPPFPVSGISRMQYYVGI